MEKKINICYQKTCYRFGWLLCNAINTSSQCFKPKIYGKENIPKESAILVANHAINLDGPLISMFMNKQIHFWVQYEDVYEKNPKLLGSIGEIPVKVQEKDRHFWKDITLEKSLFYLEKTNDFIGIFPEGPMESLNKKKSYRGAVNLACKYYKKYRKPKNIVPVGLWLPDEYKKRIKKYERGVNTKKILDIITKNAFTRIPYYINIGKGIEIKLSNSKEQKELVQHFVKKCNNLADLIKR